MSSLTLVCAFVSIFASIVCVIIVFLTRKSIVDIVDKDVILFENNFTIKKNAITAALEMVDVIDQHGKQVALNANFIQNAKKCYNDLLCVVGDIAVAKEFYDITLNQAYSVTKDHIEHFKLVCRRDIGFKTKVSKVAPTNDSMLDDNISSMLQSVQSSRRGQK